MKYKFIFENTITKKLYFKIVKWKKKKKLQNHILQNKETLFTYWNPAIWSPLTSA